MKSLKILAWAMVILSLCACESDEGSRDFDKEVLLKDLATNIIVPSYTQFSDASSSFLNATVTFTETPQEDNLIALQAEWVKMTNSWASIEMVDLGPVAINYFRTYISRWPLTETALIEEAINTTETIDETYVSNQGSTRKGLHAIEYLIFDQDNDHQKIIDAFADPNRGLYLKALAQNLVTISTQMSNDWSNTYQAEFIEKIGNGIGTSVNDLANNIIVFAENIKNKKLGAPLGKGSLTQELAPDLVESPYSKTSVEQLKENLTSLKLYFEGNGGTGLAKLIDFSTENTENHQLSEKIISQIEGIITLLDGFNTPLFTAVENQQLEQSNELYTEMENLIRLLKSDMMSALSLTLTFSDNDGD
ncbi:imelysin family protein [Limibacter armeniacum]|uniref:imelysin family protein n=1 Tax=Limibacter armeniacum TaxID=466084 RepID=UPI002FE554C5